MSVTKIVIDLPSEYEGEEAVYYVQSKSKSYTDDRMDELRTLLIKQIENGGDWYSVMDEYIKSHFSKAQIHPVEP